MNHRMHQRVCAMDLSYRLDESLARREESEKFEDAYLKMIGVPDAKEIKDERVKKMA